MSTTFNKHKTYRINGTGLHCETDNARVNTKPRRNEQADTEVQNTDFRRL